MKLSELKGYRVVGAAPTVEAEEDTDNRDGLDKTVDVLGKVFPGTKQIGESLAKAGTNIKNLAQGGREQFEAGLPENKIDVPRLVGAYTAAGASALGTSGAGMAGGVLKRALASAGVGAAMSGGASAAEGDDAAQILKDTATGAATGAAVSGAFSATEKALQSFRSLPERFVRSATGQTKKQILAGQDISKYVIENKKVGTADKLIRDSQKSIDYASEIINKNLKGSTETFKVDDVFESLAKTDDAVNAEYTVENLKDLIKQVAPQSKRLISKGDLTLEEANNLRQLLDKTIGDRGFLMAQPTLNKQFLREFSGLLREGVKTKAPEGTRAAFNTLSNEIRLRNALVEKSIKGGANQIISLGDLLSGGLGSTLGGVPGAIGGAAAKRVLQSTPFLTGSAVVIDRLDTFLSPVLEQLEPAAQTAIINALSQALTEDTE